MHEIAARQGVEAGVDEARRGHEGACYEEVGVWEESAAVGERPHAACGEGEGEENVEDWIQDHGAGGAVDLAVGGGLLGVGEDEGHGLADGGFDVD